MYRSTRSEGPLVHGAEALVKGLAPDGGLFVPESFPLASQSLLDDPSLSYPELCAQVLLPWFPELGSDQLMGATRKAMASFPVDDPAPLVSAGGLHILELFRGPTFAFKDFALSVMGDLLALAKKAEGDSRRTLILVATSGDTGKAALHGFADRPGIEVLVFYPQGGVSGVQGLQMLTHEASNGKVVGIRGNFDDAQKGVKALFSNPSLGRELEDAGLTLGSANSINIGRLLPQVAYYFHAYRSLAKRGELQSGMSFDVVVPTGNFGDALAAWYAKRMGLPVEKIIVATNSNKVLDDFFKTGTCDRRRPFFKTTSPSMDILAASNLERLIFEALGRDSQRLAALMEDFATQGWFSLAPSEKAFLGDFVSGSATDAEAAGEIRRVFDETGYLMDPHTACAASVSRALGASSRPRVILSTASPFKFPAAVSQALGLSYPETHGEGRAEIEALGRLAAAAHLELPLGIRRLADLPLRHKEVVELGAMEACLRSKAGLRSEGGRP